MRKYAITLTVNISHFDTSIYLAFESGNYTILKYHDEPDPTGEHWVIFTGEDANVKCAEYLASIILITTEQVQKLYFNTPEERDAFNAAEAEFAGADPSVPYLETGQDELGYYLMEDINA